MGSFPFQYYFMICSHFFLFIRHWKNSSYSAIFFILFFRFTCVQKKKKIVILIIRFQEQLIQNLELLLHLQFLWNNPAPLSRTTSTWAIFFQVVCIGSKKSPPISRVNKHQYNNNKRVRRESSFLEIARSEGIRSAQLGNSLLLRNRACWIHPLEFRCAEPGERLQEERQPGAPCRVSSDNIWSVAVNGYENTTTSQSILLLLLRDCFCSRIIERWGIGGE